jgi:hypothetical protein
MWLLALSVMKSNTTDATTIKNTLLEVSRSYEGALGNCTLDQYGSRVNTPSAIYKWISNSGKLEQRLIGNYAADGEATGYKPSTSNITIGVIPTTETSLLAYKLFTKLAETDINSYCAEQDLGYRFTFNITGPVERADQALQYTKALRATGVNMILGYGWSSHLCSGARVYGYNKTMVLMTPTATYPGYSLKNDTLYHLCVLEGDKIRTTLKAMRDRGVKAYLIIYNPQYGSSSLIDNLQYYLTDLPSFNENKTMAYSYDGPNLEFFEKANSAIEEMIEKYGANQTAVLWMDFPAIPDVVGLGGAKFLEKAANTTHLPTVDWYIYEDLEPGSYSGEPEAAKLKLISLSMTFPPNPIMERLNQAWLNSTGLQGQLGYTANIYDGLWVLSL